MRNALRGDAARRARRAPAGFTLLEVVVVLAVLGLVAGMFALRGPPRSQALEIRAAAGELAQALRLARGLAIARNAPVGMTFDPGRRTWRLDGSPERAMPPDVSLGVSVAAAESAGRLGAIRFAPDGSSTGGRIALADRRRRIEVGVDWLSGRVTVAEAPGSADAR